MPLHTDLRPETLDDIIGNRNVVDSLRSVVSKKNPPHTFLFTGQRGCGKTTLARIAAKELGCHGFDLKELNFADFRGIDMARDIIRKSKYKSLHGGNRGWIMDECHKMTKDAQNALLKITEQPPDHAFFFMCTTDPHLLIDTLVSRSSDFMVIPLSEKQSNLLIDRACEHVGKDIPENVKPIIYKASEGRPRDILTILEKIIDLPERQMKRAAQKITVTDSDIFQLTKTLAAGASWDKVRSLLKGLKQEDAESIRRNVMGMGATMLLNGDGKGYVLLDAFREPLYDIGWPGVVLACYEATMEED